MVAPVQPEVQSESLGKEVVFLCDMVEHVVCVYGCIHVSPQYLQARPEGQQRVHEGPGHTCGRVHTHVHQHWTIRDVPLNGSIVLRKGRLEEGRMVGMKELGERRRERGTKTSIK